MTALFLFANQKRIGEIVLNWGGGLSWGTGNYVLQRDTSSSFSSPTTLYTGQNYYFTDMTLSVGTYYYRIKYANSKWIISSIIVQYEPETTIFINKVIADAGSDSTNKPNAIDNFIKGLKRLKIWDKCVAVYPRYGSIFTTQRLNLKDPFLFGINNINTPTRTLAATDYNGISNCEDTSVIPAERLLADDVSLSVYSFENIQSNSFDMSCRSGTFRFGIQLNGGTTGANIYITGDSSTFGSLTAHSSAGRFVAKRKDGNLSMLLSAKVQRFGKITGNNTLPTQSLYLGALNNLGTAIGFSTKKQGIAVIGRYTSDNVDFEMASLVEQYLIDIGLSTTNSFMNGNVLSDSGILRDDMILN